MLTDAERQVVADAAEKYPPGFGGSFFSHNVINNYYHAIEAINHDKECLQFG